MAFLHKNPRAIILVFRIVFTIICHCVCNLTVGLCQRFVRKWAVYTGENGLFNGDKTSLRGKIAVDMSTECGQLRHFPR